MKQTKLLKQALPALALILATTASQEAVVLLNFGGTNT